MEIEKKYLVRTLPEDLKEHPHDELIQAYLCTNPVIRIRKKNDNYILTIKSSGLMIREEAEYPLPEDSFNRLLSKVEGNIIEKTRYLIPEKDGLTIELDIFHGSFEGFIMAEVEFKDIKQAEGYTPPAWFGKEVTRDPRFQNSCLSQLDQAGIRAFLTSLI
jgi:CYTH domain-containing protein